MTGPARRRWTSGEDKDLKVMLDAGRFAPEIALKLNRTPLAIYARLQRLYRKRKLWLKAKGTADNDDKSPLIDLISCVVCNQTMKLERSAPDAEGRDIIQYRCGQCNRIEQVRLFRRSRDSTD